MLESMALQPLEGLFNALFLCSKPRTMLKLLKLHDIVDADLCAVGLNDGHLQNKEKIIGVTYGWPRTCGRAFDS